MHGAASEIMRTPISQESNAVLQDQILLEIVKWARQCAENRHKTDLSPAREAELPDANSATKRDNSASTPAANEATPAANTSSNKSIAASATPSNQAENLPPKQSPAQNELAQCVKDLMVENTSLRETVGMKRSENQELLALFNALKEECEMLRGQLA